MSVCLPILVLLEDQVKLNIKRSMSSYVQWLINCMWFNA